MIRVPDQAVDYVRMNQAVAHVLQLFECIPLPQDSTVEIKELSEVFTKLARVLAAGPQNPETTVALRKLLEAKDAAVRAALVG